MKRIGLLFLLSGVVFVVARPSAMIPDQVRVETGMLAGVVGTTQPTVRVFKGIPYAAPRLPPPRPPNAAPPDVHGAPKASALRTPSHLAAGCGARHRFSPSGGAA